MTMQKLYWKRIQINMTQAEVTAWIQKYGWNSVFEYQANEYLQFAYHGDCADGAVRLKLIGSIESTVQDSGDDGYADCRMQFSVLAWYPFPVG